MRLFSAFTSIVIVYFFVAGTGSAFMSCSKSSTTHDTVVVTPPHDSLADGLVAYYNFTGGNTNDSSGNGNNTIVNTATVTADRNGKANNAYLFDGSSSYMDVANSVSLSPSGSITLFAIVKVNGFYANDCHANQILGKLSSDAENGIYALRFNDLSTPCGTAPNPNNEEFSGFFGDNGVGIAGNVTAAAVQTGQWYFLAYTYDGATAKLYVNGTLVSSQTVAITFAANTDNLYIGKTPNTNFPYYFNGVIDEVRIYNRALPQSLITKLNNVTE
ncbi:MAG TPA: LamG domain-containing protein [Puia sp.]|nr:LamG domain-containing protein [Puia sp.]